MRICWIRRTLSSGCCSNFFNVDSFYSMISRSTSILCPSSQFNQVGSVFRLVVCLFLGIDHFNFDRIVSARAEYHCNTGIAEDTHFAAVINDQSSSFINPQAHEVRVRGYCVNESNLTFPLYEVLVDYDTGYEANLDPVTMPEKCLRGSLRQGLTSP